MCAIVGTLLVVAAVLNAPSTASAAGPSSCVVTGTHAGGAKGLLVARPGQSVLEGVRVSRKPCRTTFWVDPDGGPIKALTVTGPGWHGSLHSSETRVDGLVSNAQLRDGSIEPGGDANVPALRAQLERNRSANIHVRIVLATILIALAVLYPRGAVMGGAAAIGAALALSALGWSSLVLFGLLTLAGAFLPWRALWAFFPAYLAVLALSPETQSLALLGPHPWGAGRFYGISNELETLLLAPAVVLGLAAAPLVLLVVGWSRAGADGGGLLALLGGYAVLLPRPNPRLTVAYGAGAVAVAFAFVAVDAATGGSSHVTHSVLHGGLVGAFEHRWRVSLHGAFGTWGRTVQSLLSAAALVWVATRRPRSRTVDAFLVAIAVSLVANDTPQDVLFLGAITGVGLRRSV